MHLPFVQHTSLEGSVDFSSLYGRDSYFPASKRPPNAARVPARSNVLQGAIAIAMVFLGTFDQLLTYLGLSLGIFPLLAVLGVFKLRRSGRSAV